MNVDVSGQLWQVRVIPGDHERMASARVRHLALQHRFGSPRDTSLVVY